MTAERLLRRGLWALRCTWALGLVSPLYLYVQPFVFAALFPPPWGPPRYPPLEWSTGGPDPWAFARAAPLLIGGLVVPIVWHRRSLARLSGHTRGGLDPTRLGRYREAPATLLWPAIPELAARAAVLRYLGRLAMALGMLLPVYFLAWKEGSVARCFHCAANRVIPWPSDYVPLLAVSTLLVAFHVPTRRRVLGGLRQGWTAERMTSTSLAASAADS